APRRGVEALGRELGKCGAARPLAAKVPRFDAGEERAVEVGDRAVAELTVDVGVAAARRGAGGAEEVVALDDVDLDVAEQGAGRGAVAARDVADREAALDAIGIARGQVADEATGSVGVGGDGAAGVAVGDEDVAVV